MGSTCAVHSTSYDVAKTLKDMVPGVSVETVEQYIREAVTAGDLTEEEARGQDTMLICEAILKRIQDSDDVNVEFENVYGALPIKGVEGFAADMERSAYANAYIGVNKTSAQNKYAKPKNYSTWETAENRMIVADNSEVDQDTVAYVEVYSNSSAGKTVSLVAKVLDAGGRALMPSIAEITKYAKDNAKIGKVYLKVYKEIYDALIARGYSCTQSTSPLATVWEKTKTQTFQRIEIKDSSKEGKKNKAGKTVVYSDMTEEQADEYKKKAKDAIVKVSGNFTAKDGASLRDDEVTEASTLYEAITNGEVDTISKADTTNFKYSELKEGDILPLRQDSDNVVYVEVTDVRPNLTNEQLASLMEAGTIKTGYTASSVRAMSSDYSRTAISFNVLFSAPNETKEDGRKKKKGKGKKNSNTKPTAGTKPIFITYTDKKGKKHKKLIYKKIQPTDDPALDNLKTVNIETQKMLVALQKAFYEKMFGEKLDMKQAMEDIDKALPLPKAIDSANPQEVKEAQHDIGYQVNAEQEFGQKHTFIGRIGERDDKLSEVFGGNTRMARQFAESLAVYFKNRATKAILPKKLESYEKTAQKIASSIEDGLNMKGEKATPRELKEMSMTLKAMQKNVDALKSEGWLAACKIKDVMRSTIKRVSQELQAAYIVSKDFDGRIEELQKQLGTRDRKDTIKNVGKQGVTQELKNIGNNYDVDNIVTQPYFPILASDVKHQFLSKLYGSRVEQTSTEIRDAYQADLDDLTAQLEEHPDEDLQKEIDELQAELAAIDSRSEEEKERIARRDEQIESRRKEQRAIRFEMFSRMCDELSRESGTRISFERVAGSDIQEVLGQDEEYEREDALEFESEDEVYEYSRGEAYLSANERTVHETISNEVRKTLGSLSDWYFDSEKGKFKIHLDSFFNIPKNLPSGMAFNHLLTLFTDVNNSRGFKDSDAMLDYFKANERTTGWYHGLVEAISQEPVLKTKLYNAFSKAKTRFTQLRSSAVLSEYYGWADAKSEKRDVKYNKFNIVPLNFNENCASVLGDVQANVTKGNVLEPGLSVYDSKGEWDEEGGAKLHQFCEENLKYREYGVRKFKTIVETSPEIIEAAVTLFRGIGIDCDSARVIQGFTAYPDQFALAVNEASAIAKICDPSQIKDEPKGSLFSYYSNYYKKMIVPFKALSVNRVEKTFRYNGKQMASYADRHFVDDMASKLFDSQNDDAVREYIESEYLHSDNADSSFYMQKMPDGTVQILDPLLRDIMPSPKGVKDLAHDNRSRGIRQRMSEMRMDNLGLDDEKYNRLSTAERVAIDLTRFFDPKTESGEMPMMMNGEATAQYAIPIMADKTRHIAFALPKYKSGISYAPLADKEKFGLREGDINWTLSHEPGKMLDRMAQTVIQEYNRIKTFSSSDAATRRNMGKAFEKKWGSYNFFEELNDVIVNIDGISLSITDTIRTLLSEEVNEDELRLIRLERRGVVERVDRDPRQSLLHDILATAIHKYSLNQWFKKDMDYWESEGLFNMDDNFNFNYIGDERGVIESARLKYEDRKKAWDGLVKRMFDGEVKFVNVYDQNGNPHLKPQKKYSTDDDTGIVTEKTDLWRKLSEIPGATDYLFSLSSVRFNESLYGMSDDERDLAVSAQAKLRTKIINVLSEYKEKSNDAYDKMIILLQDNAGNGAWENKLVGMLQSFSFNSVLANIEIFQLFHGDPAQFADIVEYSKREQAVVATHDSVDLAAVDVWSEGQPKFVDRYGKEEIDPTWDKTKQKALYIKDFEARKADGADKSEGFHGLSQYFNDTLQPYLAEQLSAGLLTPVEYMERCDAYCGMKITDGQAFRMPHSTRKLLGMLGAWNDSLEEIFNKIENGEKVTFDEVNYTMQQLKTVLFDHESIPVVYKDGNGESKVYMQKLSVYLKQSEFGLLLHSDMMADYLGQDSFLRGVVDFCMKHQVDTINFTSCVKIGCTNAVDLSYAKNRAEANAILERYYEAGVKDASKNIFHALSWTAIGRQQPTPNHLVDQEIGVGVQIEKIMKESLTPTWEGAVPDIDPTTNRQRVDGNGKPIFKKKTYETKVTIRDPNLNDEVLARLTPEEYNEQTNKILVEMMRRDWEKIEKRFSSKEEISKMLLESINSTDQYDDDIRHGLEINPETGDFNIPLDHPRMLRAVQPLISSLVRKRVIRQKTAGGTAFQFSSVGLTDALKVVTEKDEETGQERLKYAEAKLPAWTKKLFEAYADENGVIDINKVPIKYRQMVGYRTPTEHLYSVIPIRIVGFLDSAQGSSIMLPQEIVVWSGSDFDIDKLFIEMFSFHLKKKESNESGAEEEGGDGTEIDELPARFTDDDLTHASDEAVENALVRLHWSRMTSDFTFKMFNQPQGFALAKRISKIILALQGGTEKSMSELSRMTADELTKEAEKSEDGIGMFQASGSHRLFKRNMVGRSMVPIFALHNSFHQILQEAPLRFSEEALKRLTFMLNGKRLTGSDGNLVGFVNDETGRDICANFAICLGASLDNAKDPILEALNLNEDTVGVAIALLHLGYSMETTLLFMSQPIVKEAFKAFKSRKKTVFSLSSFLYDYMSEFGVRMTDAQSTAMTHEKMADGIKFFHGKSVEDMMMDLQQKDALRILTSVSYIAEVLESALKAVNIDSPKKSLGTTFGQTFSKMASTFRLPEINNIKIYGDYKLIDSYDMFEPKDVATLINPDFSKTSDPIKSTNEYLTGNTRLPFQQACYDFGLKRPTELMKPYIKTFGDDVQDVLFKLISMFKNSATFRMSEEDVNSFVRQYKYYRTASAAIREIMDEDEGYLSERRQAWLSSFPERFTEIIGNYKLYGTDKKPNDNQSAQKKRDLANEFLILKAISVEKVHRGEQRINVLRLSMAGKVNKETQNDLINSWYEMLNDNDAVVRELAIQLYKYSMIFNGCEYSPSTFGSLTPIALIKEFPDMLNSLRELDEPLPEAEQDRFIDQFIRNNWGNEFYGMGKKVSRMVSDKYINKRAKDLQMACGDFNSKTGKWEYKDSFSFVFQDGLDKFPYLVITLPDSSKSNQIYRKTTDQAGNYLYVRVEKLGGGAVTEMFEYDPAVDLKSAAKLDYSHINTSDAMRHNYVAERKESELRLARQREYQSYVLEDLTEKMSHVKRVIEDGQESAPGNNSKAYMRDDTGEVATRVHDFLGLSKTLEPAKGWSEWSWNDNLQMTQKIGTAIDEFVRLYFKERAEGLTAEERARMNTGFDELDYDADIRWKSANTPGSFAEVMRIRLDEFCEYNLQPGDKVLTSIGGHNIVPFAKVTPLHGEELNVAGEIDILVAHADGTFSIWDLKTSKEGPSWEAKKTNKYGTYTDYMRQVNCYRALLETMYPEIVIRDCAVLPVLYRPVLVDASIRPLRDQIHGRREGQRDLLYVTSLFIPPMLNIPNDNTLSGIKAVPKVTIEKESQEEDIKDMAKNYAYREQTYASLIDEIVGEPVSSSNMFAHIIRELDNPETEKSALDSLFNTKNALKKSQLEIRLKSVLKENYNQELLEKLETAIRAKAEVRDDEGKPIC